MLFRSLFISVAVALSVSAAPAGLADPSTVGNTSASALDRRQINTGQATYYNTSLGACGYSNNDSQLVVAVSRLLYDTYPGYTGTNPNNNPICGRKIRASYGGKSVDVTIVDRCYGCALSDLDFSPAAFTVLAPLEVGRLYGMTWQYI